jgi:hypothetical protein
VGSSAPFGMSAYGRFVTPVEGTGSCRLRLDLVEGHGDRDHESLPVEWAWRGCA